MALVHVHLRDVATFDDIADATAPAPVEPGAIVATAEDVYRVEDVLDSTGRPVVPVLVRRLELPVAAR